ncbi:MAG: hypothetical protein YPKNTGVA_001181 [Candidatus Fervidibacter sp.]
MRAASINLPCKSNRLPAPPSTQELICRRFDCGTANSPVKAGWIQVTPETIYTPERGYGWLSPPSTAFDRPEIFVPDWLKSSIRRRFVPDEMLRDGVFDRSELTFRVDVPDGEYWLVVSVGDEQATRRNMSIFANGIPIAEKVTTQTSWGGYATTRTFRKRLRVTGEKLQITFRHEGDGNSVLGMEVISFVPYPLRFVDGKWRTEETDPLFCQGVAALNRKEGQQARKLFDRLRDPLKRVVALTALANDLQMPEEEAHALLRQALQDIEPILHRTKPNASGSVLANELRRIIANYWQARQFMTMLNYEHAQQQTGMTFARRLQMAMDWLEQITEDDPLFDRALLNLLRIHYWIWREDGDEKEKTMSDAYLQRLKRRQPEAKLVRLYAGEEAVWGKELMREEPQIPPWATRCREAMGRLLTVLRWWLEHRQLENGELGGGYGDDVEMLRQWHVFLAGADDETVRRGWLKLAHGVWWSGLMDAEGGYVKEASDVQHSAEPMADTHPALIGLDYGNPVWIERCMGTARTMRNVWTAVNPQGHRHFRSAFFGAKEMKTDPPWDVDVPMNARATRPLLWLGWYNRNPIVVNLLREWMDAWVDDALREGDGKPAGVLPAAITFGTDRFAGHGLWFEPKLGWSYFHWDAFYHLHKLYDHMLAVYEWTGDEKYLRPIEAAMEWKRNPVADPPKGSRLWAGRLLYLNMAPTVEKYRILTGRTQFDDYLKERGSPYMRFLLTGDKKGLVTACEEVSANLRTNFELLTSEVLFTDRVAVTQQPMWAMMTGGVGTPYFYPCYFVTWQKTGEHFAALVTHADSRSLKVLAVNFEPKAKGVILRPWRLEPGVYEVRVGVDENGDDQIDAIRQREKVALTERGQDIPIPLLSRKVTVIEMSKVGELSQPVPPFHDRPDLAIGDQDVLIGEEEHQSRRVRPWHDGILPTNKEVRVTAVVHNIGRRQAPPSLVRLWVKGKGRWHLIGEAKGHPLDAPDDLMPRYYVVSFRWRPSSAGEWLLKVTVMPLTACYEITQRNNSLVRKVKVTTSLKG